MVSLGDAELPRLAIKRNDGYLWFWIGDHKAYDVLVSTVS